MAERWYTRLSSVFNHQLRNGQVVGLYGNGEQFRQTNMSRKISVKEREVTEALGHELVHAFQYDITNSSASSAAAGRAGLMDLPLWFIEGMAEYFSQIW